MPRAETLAEFRKQFPEYNDLRDSQLGAMLAAKYPQDYGDLAVPVHPWVAVTKAAREGTPIPGTEELPHPAEVLLTAASLPVTGGAGQLARAAVPRVLKPLAAALGRSGAMAGLGAGEAAAKGADATARGTMTGGAALGAETLLSLIPRAKIPWLTRSIKDLAEEAGSWKTAYKKATEAIGSAFDAVKDRIPKGKWLNVPTIDKAKRLTPTEAQRGLEKLEGLDYEQARKEIIAELTRLDIRNIPKRLGGGGPRPYAGQAFEMRTRPQRFTPPLQPGHKFGELAAAALGAPGTRTAADVAASQDVMGVPAGVIGAYGLKDFAAQLPVVGRFIRAAESFGSGG